MKIEEPVCHIVHMAQMCVHKILELAFINYILIAVILISRYKEL